MKNKKGFTLLLSLFLGIGIIVFTGYFKQNRRLKRQNLISETIFNQEENKWIKNSFYGLNFESPNVGLTVDSEINDFDLVGVKTAKANFLLTGDLFYSVLFMDIESDEYDLEKGIQGILSNLISEIKGTNLKYKFKMSEDWIQFGTAEGSFDLQSENFSIKAFLSFNNGQNHNNLRSLVIYGNVSEQNNEQMNQSIGSIELDCIKSEKNFLRWQFLKGQTPEKLIDQPDSTTFAERKANVKSFLEWAKKEGHFKKKDID